MTSLVLTAHGEDRQGFVAAVSAAIKGVGGVWESGHFSHLGGKFAGVLLVQVDDESVALLRESLEPLADTGVTITIERTDEKPPPYTDALQLDLVGADRPEIVAEISALLSEQSPHIHSLETSTEKGPTPGDPMFRARALLAAPGGPDDRDLQAALDSLSAEVTADLKAPEG